MATTEKYTLFERERKFILSYDSISLQHLPFKIITDKYLINSFLRIRKVEDTEGITYKLTKKINTAISGEAAITTIYLSEEEYLMLQNLTGVEIIKTRFLKITDNILIGIDKYKNLSKELLIAEVEFCSVQEMEDFEMPIPYLKEVTFNAAYNGYELANEFQIDDKSSRQK